VQSSAGVLADLRRIRLGLDVLRQAELDRCCEEPATLAALARDLDLPSALTQLAGQACHWALRRYGTASRELLAMALLEAESGIRLHHGPA
jgi:hypothetical protein